MRNQTFCLVRPTGRVALLGLILGVVGPTSAGEATPVTFTEQVVSIIFNNCALCHRPGQGAPFSILSYRDVRKRGQFIRDVVKSGTIPPWPPGLGALPG